MRTFRLGKDFIAENILENRKVKTFKNRLKTLLAAIVTVVVAIALCIGLVFVLGWIITTLSVSWIVVAIVLFIAGVAMIFCAIKGTMNVEEEEDEEQG